MLLRVLLSLGLLVSLLADPSFAQNKRGGSGGGTALSVEEEDGSPAVSGVATLKFPNGTVTDNGGNSVSVTTGGAPTDATYLTKTANGTLSAEQALGSLSTGCLGVTTTSGDVASRTITGTASEIAVANGNCSGNPTLSLPSAIDLGGKTVEIPNSNTLPATCNVGEIYMDTDATTGQRIYACQATDTWALQGDGGSGGTNALLDGTAHTDTLAGTVVRGDIMCGNSTPKWARLARGATGEVLFTDSNGDCAWGTVDAANKALSNLASVALNTALLPDAAAADDFGSATLPFKDFFLAGSSGTPGTNNFRITGASTSGTRVITLPNATATLAGTTVALGGTGATSFTGSRCVQTNAGGTALESASAACGGTNSFVITLSSGGGTTANSFTWADATTFNYGVGEILSAGAANEAAVCIPVPVTSTLTAVYYHVRVAGTLQSADGANTLQVRNQSTATDTTGTTATFTAASTTANETGLSVAFTAGNCVSGKLVTASPATDPTVLKIHASLYFTVP